MSRHMWLLFVISALVLIVGNALILLRTAKKPKVPGSVKPSRIKMTNIMLGKSMAFDYISTKEKWTADTEMLEHKDDLIVLSRYASFAQKLELLHETGSIGKKVAMLDCIAVASFENTSERLVAIAHSGDGEFPGIALNGKISNYPALYELLLNKTVGIVADDELLRDGWPRNADAPGGSYTLPIIHKDLFYGFVFFHSTGDEAFHDQFLSEYDLIGHLIMLLAVEEWVGTHSLVATLRSVQSMVSKRDPETGMHMERMAFYSKMIAVELAGIYGFDEAFIDNILLFAPLHDIGKIGIADEILFKPGKYSAKEYDIMKEHPVIGRDLIDSVLDHHGLIGGKQVEMLRNIVEYHHELLDGSGYPSGLQGDEIPIESKIVAVADVFDAMTSMRIYKSALDNDAAFQYLRENSGIRLDSQCVEALLKNRNQIEEIQLKFYENKYG